MKNLNSLLVTFILLASQILFAADDLAITVTNSNVALVRESRQFNLNKGVQQFNLLDIPAQIQPTSVLIESKNNLFTVLEQNYEYDLVDVSKILQKSVNKKIRLVHPELGDMNGELISVSSDHIMLLDANKQMQIIPRSDELKIYVSEFNTQNNNFVTQPTLVWLVDAANQGNHTGDISYLTNGLNWHADYVGQLNENQTALNLASWVTVTNNSGKTFKDARLKLMAGDLNFVQQAQLPRTSGNMVEKTFSAPSFTEKSFFEYHLYNLNRKTTIADNQIKQIQLFPEIETSVKKKYTVNSDKGDAVNVIVTLKNSKEKGLGFPLPKGKVRLYKADGKDLEFIGEDLLEHTAVNENFDIKVGQAFDIVCERVVASNERPTSRSHRRVIEYNIRNHKDVDIVVDVTEKLSIRQQSELLSSNIRPKKDDASGFLFEVPVKANGEFQLSLEYVISW